MTDQDDIVEIIEEADSVEVVAVTKGKRPKELTKKKKKKKKETDRDRKKKKKDKKGKKEKKPKKATKKKVRFDADADINVDTDNNDPSLQPGILSVIGQELQTASSMITQGYTTDRIATTSERLVDSVPFLAPKPAPRLDPMDYETVPGSDHGAVEEDLIIEEGEGEFDEDIIAQAVKLSNVASGAAGMKRVIQIVRRLAEQRKLTDTLGMSITPKESQDGTTQILGRPSLLQAYSEMALDWERFKYNPVIAPPTPVSVQNTFSRPKGPAATWERSCVMGRECIAYQKGIKRLRDISRGARDPREPQRSMVATSKQVTGEDGEVRKKSSASAAMAFNNKPWPCREWVPSAVRADHERLRKAYLTAVATERARGDGKDPHLSPAVRTVLDEGAAYAQTQEYHHMCIQCYRTLTIKHMRKYKLFKQQRSDATPPETPMTRDEHLRDDLKKDQPRVLQLWSDQFGCVDGFNESCRFVVEDGYCGIIGDMARDDAVGMVYTEGAYTDIDGTPLPAWLYCMEWLFR